jgi:hypothetical protein
MNKLYPEHLTRLAQEIDEYRHQYPKADIFFNLDEKRIQIELPLPRDFPKLVNWKVVTEEQL